MKPQKSRQRFAFWQAVIFLALVPTQACDEDALLGLEAQPGNQLIGVEVIDTFTVVGEVVPGVTSRTDEGTALLGHMRDAYFGLTRASLYTELSVPLSTLDSLPDGFDYVVDSAVLHLRTFAAYGNHQTQQTFQVYELEDSLALLDQYSSDSTVLIKPTMLGSRNFAVWDDSLFGGESNVLINPYSGERTDEMQIRIPIGVELGQRLVDGIGKIYTDLPSFRSYFRGLYITPDTTTDPGDASGAIYSILPVSNQTNLFVFYRKIDQSTGEEEDEILAFPIRANSARFNNFRHDYSGTQAAEARDSEGLDEHLFVEGMDGIRSFISFPYLYEFASNNRIAVNKATLEIPLAEIQPSVFPNQQGLLLLNSTVSGDELTTLDFEVSTLRYGGKYDAEAGSYTFDVTRHIQSVVDLAQVGENLNRGMFLQAQFTGINLHLAARTILDGAPNMELKLYYTPLNTK